MSDDADQEDKAYEPTPQKLEQAREKGDVPQSRELHSFCLYLGLLIASYFVSPWSFNYLGEALLKIFANAPDLLIQNNTQSLSYALGDLMLHVVIAIAPIFLLLMIFPLLSMIVQQSITFAPEKIMFDFSHVSIIKGFKNKFGKNALVEFAKGCVKVALIGICVYHIAKPMMDTAPALIGSDSRQFIVALSYVWKEILIAVTTIGAVIGLFDYFWQRYSFMERMMMTFQELKDEMKSSEGDPHAKAARQQMGREIAMNQMLAEVPKADVIIVNPTHYAVALKWDKAGGGAPICIAKGIDEIALAIKAKATELGIPVRPDPPLARTLYATLNIGEEVLEEHYRAVAAAIRFADEQRRKQKNRVF